MHVIDGWERNTYKLCEDKLIANHASGGAGYFADSFYEYKDGQMIMRECVFCDVDRNMENPWFYSAVERLDMNAEPITAERAEEIVASHPEIEIVFVPFVNKE